MKFELRPMTVSDLEAVLKIRNHPRIREVSISTREIKMEDHTRWFHDVKAFRFVFTVDDSLVGVAIVHEPVEGKKIYEWSFYLNQSETSQGFSTIMLSALLYELKSMLPPGSTIEGKVKLGNYRSDKIHEKFGFKQYGTHEASGSVYIIYRRPLVRATRREGVMSHVVFN
jgi:L-amino acid N-acyltransferase YncA